MHNLIINKQHIFPMNKYFNECHASTLLPLHNGDVVCAWFAGSYESHVDVSIWVSVRRTGVWSEPLCVADDNHYPCWNPVLHLGRNGMIYLYYKVGENPKVWHTMYTVSLDNGRTFGPAKKLVEDDCFGRGPVKNKILVTSKGRWLAPASIETEQSFDAFVDVSCDGGKTFTMSNVLKVESKTGQGIIQPTLWESEEDHIHMLLRSSENKIFRSDSEDGGFTWCQPYATELPNNNSGIDAVKLKDMVVLVYNPIGVNWGQRTPLSMAVSKDNGATWPYKFVLEHNEAPTSRTDGEFSYPAISERGGKIFITYTWKRKTIEFIEAQLTREDFIW